MRGTIIMADEIKVVILMVLGVMLLIFIAPLIGFWVAYFCGWIAKITFGTKLAAALNMLFQTTYFTKDMIPTVAGALGWIGGFFKSTTAVKESNK